MPDTNREPLHLLSIVIPARNEEGCIGSTVEHLHVELRLRGVPHEIVVVDDGSDDSTWQKLLESPRTRPHSAARAEYRPAWFRPRHHLRP